MKNKLVFLVPRSSYDSLYSCCEYIAGKIKSKVPMDAQVMEDWMGLDITKLEEDLKNGTKLVLVNGVLINEANPRIEAVIDKYADNICVYYKDNPLKLVKNIEILKDRVKVFVADGSYGKFLKKYYKIDSTVLVNPAIGTETEKPYSVRSNELIFIGTYFEPKDQLKYIEDNIPKAFKKISDNIIAAINKNLTADVEECIINELTKLGKGSDKKLIKAFLEGYADYFMEYQSRVARRNVIVGLLKAHRVVAVAGYNWDTLQKSLPEKVAETFNVQTSIPTGVGLSEMMSNVKKVLCVETGYSEGCHERLGAGLIAGCQVYAIDTPFTRKLAEVTPQLKVYDPNDIKGLNAMLNRGDKENAEYGAIPECLKLDNTIDVLLKHFYGKDYEDVILNAEKKSIVRANGIAYIKRSDKEFLLLNSANDRIEALVDLDNIVARIKPSTIYTAVVSGTDDVLRCFFSFKNKIPYKVYYVPDDYKKALAYIDEFGLTKKLAKRLVVFKTKEELREYLINHDEEYLPRLFYGDTGYFKSMTDELHKIRIAKPRNPKIKPFITVAVPSFNRGPIALKTIKRMLKSEFDSEIEFLLSDNGSEVGREEYKKIAAIKDSRFKYSRNRENLRFTGNILKLTKLAKGKYIYYSSDEDELYTENLHIILDGLIKENDIDIIGVYAPGRDYHANAVFNDYITVFDNAINSNYLTGTFFRVSNLSKKRVDEISEKYKENEFFRLYTHVVYAILSIKSAKMMTFTTELYKERDAGEDQTNALVRLNKAEHRAQMADAAIEIIFNEIDVHPSLKASLIAERIITAYRLVGVGHYNLEEAYKKEGITIEDDYAYLDEWRDKRLIELIKKFNGEDSEALVKNTLEGVEEEKSQFLAYINRRGN